MWREGLSAGARKGRAVATVNVDHNILKHMLKHAMKRDLLARNVACLVAAPKPKNARDRVLESDEWARLYDGAPGWFKPVLLTGYHTGMRLEEILTLTWDRVEIERGRIFLPIALTKTKQDGPVTLHDCEHVFGIPGGRRIGAERNKVDVCRRVPHRQFATTPKASTVPLNEASRKGQRFSVFPAPSPHLTF